MGMVVFVVFMIGMHVLVRSMFAAVLVAVFGHGVVRMIMGMLMSVIVCVFMLMRVTVGIGTMRMGMLVLMSVRMLVSMSMRMRMFIDLCNFMARTPWAFETGTLTWLIVGASALELK